MEALPVPNPTPEVEVAETQPTQQEKGQDKINKMEAVRRSLKKLGKTATPTAIQADVKARFGVEMSTDHISTCKGDIARKEREQKEAKKQAANKSQERPAQAPPATAGTGRKASIALEDVLAVKSLVARVGAGQLRTLIDAFER
jgi:hypothetical protein